MCFLTANGAIYYLGTTAVLRHHVGYRGSLDSLDSSDRELKLDIHLSLRHTRHHRCSATPPS